MINWLSLIKRILLKREYQDLSEGIEIYNKESLEGSKEFLNNIRVNLRHDIAHKARDYKKIKLSSYMPRIDEICKNFHNDEVLKHIEEML